MFHMTEVSGEHRRSAAYFPVVMSEFLSDGLFLHLPLGSVEVIHRAVGTPLEPMIEMLEAALGEPSDICDLVLSVFLHFLRFESLIFHAWKRRGCGYGVEACNKSVGVTNRPTVFLVVKAGKSDLTLPDPRTGKITGVFMTNEKEDCHHNGS